MANDPQRRAPPIGRPSPPVASRPEPPDPPAPPVPPVVQGATKTFSIKMESWLADLAVDINAPMPVDDKGAPLETYPLDPFVPPPRGPTPVPPALVHYYPESLEPMAPPLATLPVAPSPAGVSAPLASAVPPIPALAASAVPPIPGLTAREPRFDEPGRRGPSVLAVLAAVVVVLVGAGVAGWLLWGERIRALLKI